MFAIVVGASRSLTSVLLSFFSRRPDRSTAQPAVVDVVTRDPAAQAELEEMSW
jgi:hypothetical protein